MNQVEVDVLADLHFCYELDEITGTVVYDAHGSNDGVMEFSDNNLTIGVTGKLDKCHYRTGQMDGFSSPTDTYTLSDYTISLWIKGDPGPGLLDVWYIYTFFGAGEGLRMIPDITSGVFAAQPTIWTGSEYLTLNPIPVATLTESTWTHILVSRTTSYYKLYINGSLEYAYFGTLGSFNYQQVRGGGSPYYNDWEGYYDQFCFWKRNLSSSDAKYLYNNNSGRKYGDW